MKDANASTTKVLSSKFLPQRAEELQLVRYREYVCAQLSPTMRQAHGPAKKLFVDLASDTVPIFDPQSARNGAPISSSPANLSGLRNARRSFDCSQIYIEKLI